jgi:uncharacterized integral membrane protein
MGYPTYKRRRPSLVRNLWVYRRLVAAALVLGLLLWFVVINSAPVTVYFPFKLGEISSTAGIIVLLGAAAGSIITALVMTIVLAVRRYKSGAGDAGGFDPEATLPEERPPTDYAAKTGEGFGATWSVAPD